MIPKYYIGKSGKKYEYKTHCNFGSGDRGLIKDLPKEDYPYTIKYICTVRLGNSPS